MSVNYRAELVGVFGDPVEDNPTGVMEEAARIIGAVNTIVVKDGKLFGENTDGKGFVQALSNKGISLEDKNVVILGAGGAAKAIAVECALAGASQVSIFNRTQSKAEKLAEVIRKNTKADANAYAWEKGLKIPEKTDILINATSIGFSPDITAKPDIDYSTVTDQMTACDVVFHPAETEFLKSCAVQGARTVNGLGMLACQGTLNFTLWTGVEAPLAVMEEKLRTELEKQ